MVNGHRKQWFRLLQNNAHTLTVFMTLHDTYTFNEHSIFGFWINNEGLKGKESVAYFVLHFYSVSRKGIASLKEITVIRNTVDFLDCIIS